MRSEQMFRRNEADQKYTLTYHLRLKLMKSTIQHVYTQIQLQWACCGLAVAFPNLKHFKTGTTRSLPPLLLSVVGWRGESLRGTEGKDRGLR